MSECRCWCCWPPWCAPLHAEKVIADWNGLMIAPLAQAGTGFDEEGWIAAAVGAFEFVASRMTEARMTEEGRLRHSYRADKLGDVAFIDDYAAMARAAIALYEATGEAAYLARAEDWVAVADRHYWDADEGGYFFTADDGEALIVRSKTAYDSATPTGNGLMPGVLARPPAPPAKPASPPPGPAPAPASALDAQHNRAACCALLNGFDLLRNSIQVVIIGEIADDATRKLRRAVYETNAPNRILATIAPGIAPGIAPDAALPEGHPAQGKAAIDGKPTAYVCKGETCSLPITEPDALREALSRG